MSAVRRRRAALIGLSGISLAAAGAIAPGAFAAETVDGDVKVSNTETVQVATDASGTVDAKRVYDQLVLTGKGQVDISNPVSTDGLRNLDGFGGFDVRDGKVRVKTDVDGTKKFRSVSSFTKKLPLSIKATYLLDGKKIDPSDVVGKSGDLEVRYVVTNTTGTTQDVTFKDGSGTETSKPEEVVVPMVASMTTVLPSTFTKVETQGANAAGDGRGGTQLSFTMTLIPPIGSATAEIGYKAQVKDAVIPSASISALPVDPLQNTSFATAAAGYSGGAQTGQDLTAGATEIDANVLKLRDGASDLVNGIVQLRDGADQLSAGLTNDAAPGAKKLADGADKLDAGAKKLKAGTGSLSAGTSDLKGGAGDLNDGAEAISDGLAKIRAGVNATKDSPGLVAGTDQLAAGLDQLDASLAAFKQGISQGTEKNGNQGLDNVIIPRVEGAISELTKKGATPETFGGLQALDYAENTLLTRLIASLAGDPRLPLAQGASDLVGGVHDKLAGPSGVEGLQELQTGLVTLSATVAGTIGGSGDGPKASLRGGLAAARTGANSLKKSAPTLVGGVNQLGDGAKKLQAGTDSLVDGATRLNSGAGQLNSGAGDLSNGTDQLADGATRLSDGLATAADGSGKLAAGLDTAAESAPALPEGADRLSKEGTSVLVGKGDATAQDFGLRYALLEAGAQRAATAQPYGSPEGAMALTAYKYEMAGESGEDSANLKRGLAAVVLLAAAGLVATIRRRGII